MKRLILILRALILLPVVSAAQEAQNQKLEIYHLWDKNVESLKAEGDFETGKWRKLYDSLRADPPEMVRSLDREQIIDDLIRLHKERIAYLERMRAIERQH